MSLFKEFIILASFLVSFINALALALPYWRKIDRQDSTSYDGFWHSCTDKETFNCVAGADSDGYFLLFCSNNNATQKKIFHILILI